MSQETFLYVDLTDKIIRSAITVHKAIGPGYSEKVYQRAMAKQLSKDKIHYISQKRIDISYLDEKIGYQFLDFLIEDKVIVELKAVDELKNVYLSQVISYLKATRLNVGLVLNFATPTLGIKRVAL